MSYGAPDWTREEISTLRAMRAKKAPLAEIAKSLPGRTAKGVDNVIRRLGLPRHVRSCKPRAVKPESPPPEYYAAEALRVATIGAIARYARDNAIDIDTAAGRLLSGRVG